MSASVVFASIAVAASMAPVVPARAADGDAASGASHRDDVSEQMRRLPWQEGPVTATIGSRAHLALPKDSGLLPESSSNRFLELSGNLPEPGLTILARNGWWATFDFQDSGYVKDDEKLDPDALLAALKDNQEKSNEERRKRGLAELTTSGWIVQPHYDPTTKYLEWGIDLRASDSPRTSVNYTMRLLGRKGYESVILVTSPERLDADVKDLHTVLDGFTFDSGERYSEFRPGDHVAEFGLGALVLGGAAAAAVKAGWFKGLLAALAVGWKFVLAAVVALGAGVRKFAARVRGNKPGA